MKSHGSHTGDRSLPIITAILAAIVGVLGIVFAQSDQVDRIAEHASEMRHAEQAISAIVEFRANLGISLVLASADASGLPVEESPDLAIEQTRRSLTDLERAATSIERTDEKDTLTETTVLAEQVLVILESGDLEGANELARGSLLPVLAQLETFLAGRAREAAQIISIEGSSAGDVARAMSLAVALIVPSLAVLVVRRSLRRRAEREVLEIELETERAHNRDRDELITSLSHQIRTPLAGVYGFAEAMADLLKADLAERSFLEEAATAIFSESFEIRRLIDDLFVAARDDSGTLEKSIVEVEVERAAETALEPFSKTGISATIDVDPGVVLADYLRLQHILRNLIHNAASHGGGQIELLGRAEGDAYRLMVIDDGRGLIAGSPASRFAPFIHRGPQATTSGSLGLGLAVAQSLAELMNGTLVYERRAGKSLFVLTLERTVSTSARMEPQSSSR